MDVSDHLYVIEEHISALVRQIGSVDDSINSLKGDLDSFKDDFYTFVNSQGFANRAQTSETRLVRLRQELSKKYGHYDSVRRVAIGILQASDIGIIRQKIIDNVTEKMMIDTPAYWLTPCLIALSDWIADKKDRAYEALGEALRRNDKKTALFFALICRRAGRQAACLKWVEAYLAKQSERDLDAHVVFILSAYANGLWGNDGEGVIGQQIKQWFDRLKSNPALIEQQQERWQKHLHLMRPENLNEHLDYPFLKRYCQEWDGLLETMAGAYLHERVYAYFCDIFQQENNAGNLKKQLDDLLFSLVSSFDEEELPLRREEAFEQFVLENNGNEKAAQKYMEISQPTLKAHKNFAELLTDAGFDPTRAHCDILMQKFAIALTQDWIKNAYGDEIAQNQSKVPHLLHLKLDDDFTFESVSGDNEEAVLASYDDFVDEKLAELMRGRDLTAFYMLCKYLRWLLLLLCVIFFHTSRYLDCFYSLIGACFCYYQYASRARKYKATEKRRLELAKHRQNGKEVIRSLEAEIVDFREAFSIKDAEAQMVMDFLDNLAPSQFVQHRGNVRNIHQKVIQ